MLSALLTNTTVGGMTVGVKQSSSHVCQFVVWSFFFEIETHCCCQDLSSKQKAVGLIKSLKVTITRRYDRHHPPSKKPAFHRQLCTTRAAGIMLNTSHFNALAQSTTNQSPPSIVALEQAPLVLIHHEQFLPSASYFAVFRPPKVTLTPNRIFLSNDHLLERLLGDIIIGAGVTAMVSPFLTVIDKALVQKSAGSATVVGSMIGSVSSMIKNPIGYVKSPTFLWMWATYAATYTVANSIKTITEHRQQVSSSSRSRVRMAAAADASTSSSNDALSKGAIFLGTTMANTTACLAKDRAYAKLFGNPAATKVPNISYAAWLLRDFSVIGSSFILPDYVAPVVKDAFTLSDTTARHVAQVGTPMVAQLVAGPLHFLGLDCFNRDLSKMGLTKRILDRSRFLARTFKDVALARMIRVLPGYGVAGIANANLRNKWREHLKRKEVCEILEANRHL